MSCMEKKAGRERKLLIVSDIEGTRSLLVSKVYGKGVVVVRIEPVVPDRSIRPVISKYHRTAAFPQIGYCRIHMELGPEIRTPFFIQIQIWSDIIVEIL